MNASIIFCFAIGLTIAECAQVSTNKSNQDNSKDKRGAISSYGSPTQGTYGTSEAALPASGFAPISSPIVSPYAGHTAAAPAVAPSPYSSLAIAPHNLLYGGHGLDYSALAGYGGYGGLGHFAAAPAYSFGVSAPLPSYRVGPVSFASPPAHATAPYLSSPYSAAAYGGLHLTPSAAHADYPPLAPAYPGSNLFSPSPAASAGLSSYVSHGSGSPYPSSPSYSSFSESGSGSYSSSPSAGYSSPPSGGYSSSSSSFSSPDSSYESYSGPASSSSYSAPSSSYSSPSSSYSSPSSSYSSPSSSYSSPSSYSSSPYSGRSYKSISSPHDYSSSGGYSGKGLSYSNPGSYSNGGYSKY